MEGGHEPDGLKPGQTDGPRGPLAVPEGIVRTQAAVLPLRADLLGVRYSGD